MSRVRRPADWLRRSARREVGAVVAMVAVLAVAPFVVNSYVLTVLINVMFMALLGLAWNIMFGFAGQLSLGHALFVGLGAYTSAAIAVHFGYGPAFGASAAVLVATAVGALVGVLGFRFSISGVYFILLTIAFSEFVRILVNHLDWLGGTGGLFLPVRNRSSSDILNLRGSPEMFYYVILTFTGLTLALCAALLRSRLGFYWLAIRENPRAAEALGVDVFRYKMLAVMLSTALTAIGGVFYAFYYNNLFPDQIFSVGFSIEITLGPIVGGVGTLFGPIIGALLLSPLGELLTAWTAQWKIDGLKQLFFGITVVLIIMYQPMGIWPWLYGKLRSRKPTAD